MIDAHIQYSTPDAIDAQHASQSIPTAIRVQVHGQIGIDHVHVRANQPKLENTTVNATKTGTTFTGTQFP
jgi:hypothetical protein